MERGERGVGPRGAKIDNAIPRLPLSPSTQLAPALLSFLLLRFSCRLSPGPGLVLAWSSPCRPVVAGRRDEFQKRQLHKCLLLRFLPLSAEREGDGYPQVSGISLTKGKLSSDCCPRHDQPASPNARNAVIGIRRTSRISRR